MNEDAVYAAARSVIECGLAGDGSAFTPGRAVWTAEAADELYTKFVQQPDIGKGSFVKKLQGQPGAASPAAVQLMGEIIYLHLLLPRDIGAAAKRSVIGGAEACGVPDDEADRLPGVRPPQPVKRLQQPPPVGRGTWHDRYGSVQVLQRWRRSYWPR